MPKPVIPAIEPFWATSDNRLVRLYQGDAKAVLRSLPANSVHCVVTSPPYYGLRDYGTAIWDGGDPVCDHKAPSRFDYPLNPGLGPTGVQDQASNAGSGSVRQYRDLCGKCGARRIDRQVGLEPTVEDYIAAMVSVFAEVYRVLRDDGTVWLNIGDSYSAGSRRGPQPAQTLRGKASSEAPDRVSGGLPAGSLLGVPWRLAFALQAWGWVLRQDVIWRKPSPMPESVRNRCTRSHEYIFLLTKGMDYYYDAAPIRETSTDKQSRVYEENHQATWRQGVDGSRPTGRIVDDGGKAYGCPSSGRNKRSVWSIDDEQALLNWLCENNPEVLSEYLTDCGNRGSVWTIPSQGYAGAHFATFPVKLVEPCILAGTSACGCCSDCGSPWQRVTERTKLTRTRPNEHVKRTDKTVGNRCANTVAGVGVKTVGWEPTCDCRAEFIRPCTVLDPFVGSGTTCIAALSHGRNSIGIDLNADYLTNHAIVRIEGELLTRPGLVASVGRIGGPLEIGTRVA